MNQATNLIQWKNLTEDQRADFDIMYTYNVQTNSGDFRRSVNPSFCGENVYQLVIQPDKWYIISPYNSAHLGKDILLEHRQDWRKLETLRPAKPDEIPKPEKTLEERIKEEWPDYEVGMFGWKGGYWCHKNDGTLHTNAQSMKGFYKYAYLQDESIVLTYKATKSWKGKTIFPVAALFEGE